jgi:hypothetical protein
MHGCKTAVVHANFRIMITRIWHGATSIENAEAYLNFLLSDGTRDYRATKGNVSVKVWRKFEGDICHFWTVTEWTDIGAIQAFAGEEYDRAKYYPFDEGMLLAFEERVEHYEAFDAGG